MPTFYVEVWQPTGQQAEHHARFADFHEAVAWIDMRLAEDQSRLPRLMGYTDGRQHEAMMARGMAPG